MAVTAFKNVEHSYLSWIRANPNGFVVNTDRIPTSRYLVLHRASCSSISTYAGKVSPGAFTERNYGKTCSLRLPELRAWASTYSKSGFTSVCSRCLPGPSIQRDVQATEQAAFDKAVGQALLDTTAHRRARLATATKNPSTRTVTATVFDRNPDVVAEVLFLAAGICGCCKMQAPFLRASDSTPYLEVHHILPLANGGEDTVANAQAQCPNCHREQHYG